MKRTSVFSIYRARRRKQVRPVVFYPLLLSCLWSVCMLVYRQNRELAVWHLESARSLIPNDNAPPAHLALDYGKLYEVSIHPIDDLVVQADDDFDKMLSQRTSGLNEAAAAYRKRRGRHPPPDFDKWVAYAEEKGAVMIESMFDQIYEDLEPFWASPPETIRDQAASWPLVLSIRFGKVERRSKIIEEDLPDVIGRWESLLWDIPGDYLPDVDMAMNPDEEPHLFIPHETMTQYMDIARRTQHTNLPTASHQIHDDFSAYDPINEDPTFSSFGDTPARPSIWDLTRNACPPDCPARGLDQEPDLTLLPEFPTHHLPHTLSGYISNWTAATYICDNPHLRNLHGYFIGAPIHSAANWRSESFYSTDRLLSRHLFPLFSASKLKGINNDIILPDPGSLPPLSYDLEPDITSRHYGEDEGANPSEDFDPFDPPFASKKPTLLYRAPTTDTPHYLRSHAHRLVAALNSSLLHVHSNILDAPPPDHIPGRPLGSADGRQTSTSAPDLPYNFQIPGPELFPLRCMEVVRNLGGWVSGWADVAFSDLGCAPKSGWDATEGCYSSQFYRTKPALSSKEQNRARYRLSLDGNAGSSVDFEEGVRSRSAAIHSTLHTTWSTSRLTPWRHFIPLSPTCSEIYGIMEYLLGYAPGKRERALGARGVEGAGLGAGAGNGEEGVGEGIAERGREWGKKVLRREDMVLYVWRVVGEYARVCDGRRESMGWVEDLVGEGG